MSIRLWHVALGAALVTFGAAAVATSAVKVGYIQASSPDAPVAPGSALALRGGGVAARSVSGSLPRQLMVPDLFAVLPAGLSTGQVRAIGGLAGVRAVLAVDGGQMVINGRAASMLGVPPQAFRSWTPPATAAAGIWARLSGFQLIASPSAAGRLGLTAGRGYPVSAAARGQVWFGASAELGIPGVDAIVSRGLAARLGLTADVAVLTSAPAADPGTLIRRIRDILGPDGKVVDLVPVVAVTSLPVDDNVPGGRPANWLQLYRDAAARYCPGLSWTVLAAIGEIESGDGASDGPSAAGALGPMQFLPSTWRVWGIGGFGRTGAPDIMSPLDAVPSAARMLCADGAARGGAALAAAIYRYNHAAWYLGEVLALAGEYAQEYP